VWYRKGSSPIYSWLDARRMNDLRFFIELLMWLVLFALLSRLWLSIADAKREADSDSNLWKTSLPRIRTG
jgi:hypothetical protein